MVKRTTSDVSVPNRSIFRHPALFGALVVTACSAPATVLSPFASAARSFRPLSALYFLPDRPPVTAVDGAALVPDSKIEWDLRVTAQQLGLSTVRVSVSAQQVRLRGTVPSAESRAVLLDVARRTTGAKSVTDELEIRP